MYFVVLLLLRLEKMLVCFLYRLAPKPRGSPLTTQSWDGETRLNIWAFSNSQPVVLSGFRKPRALQDHNKADFEIQRYMRFVLSSHPHKLRLEPVLICIYLSGSVQHQFVSRSTESVPFNRIRTVQPNPYRSTESVLFNRIRTVQPNPYCSGQLQANVIDISIGNSIV